ncbi:MAG: glycosyltransferase family 39 protein [Desulfobacterales bacterium]|nr:MAG: glycosyltransferase family 39 protein [Desulfobacterales bacterium]
MFRNMAGYREIFRYGRCVIILLGCFLGWLLFVFAKEIYGYEGALFGLFLYVLNPNIIAHSRLVTIDTGASCIIFLSLYCFWKFLKKGNAGLPLSVAPLLG